MNSVVCQLLNSDEPSVRLKIRVHLLDKDLESDEIQQLRPFTGKLERYQQETHE